MQINNVMQKDNGSELGLRLTLNNLHMGRIMNQAIRLKQNIPVASKIWHVQCLYIFLKCIKNETF